MTETRYTFDDDTLGFDFYSTDPPVFEIVVEHCPSYRGRFARAVFRGGHTDSYLYGIVAWGETEAAALAELLTQLKRYEVT